LNAKIDLLTTSGQLNCSKYTTLNDKLEEGVSNYITNLKTYTENTEKSQIYTELRNQISVALCGSRWNSV